MAFDFIFKICRYFFVIWAKIRKGRCTRSVFFWCILSDGSDGRPVNSGSLLYYLLNLLMMNILLIQKKKLIFLLFYVICLGFSLGLVSCIGNGLVKLDFFFSFSISQLELIRSADCILNLFFFRFFRFSENVLRLILLVGQTRIFILITKKFSL